MSAELIPTPKFGDLVENGWASEGNPTRRGYFVQSFRRTGRMNPGLTWEIRGLTFARDITAPT